LAKSRLRSYHSLSAGFNSGAYQHHTLTRPRARTTDRAPRGARVRPFGGEQPAWNSRRISVLIRFSVHHWSPTCSFISSTERHS
jgi:hypothetical protein